MEQINNTTEKIIAAIDKRKVVPRPKWYFVLRNSAMWIPGLITTLLGAYTIAGVLYGILHAHWESRQYVHYSGTLAFIAVIPLLWVISFGLFLLITVSLLRKTNTGYRHTALQLLLISVASSIIIGILFYALTVNSAHDGFEVYYRHPTQSEQEQLWNDPDANRISGVITTVDNNSLSVTSFNGFIWTVDTSTLPLNTDPALLQTGNAIRIVGVITSPHSFSACRILPWELFPSEPQSLLPSPVFTVPAKPSTCDELLHNFSQ